jgi:hypothetical protein
VCAVAVHLDDRVRRHVNDLPVVETARLNERLPPAMATRNFVDHSTVGHPAVGERLGVTLVERMVEASRQFANRYVILDLLHPPDKRPEVAAGILGHVIILQFSNHDVPASLRPPSPVRESDALSTQLCFIYGLTLSPIYEVLSGHFVTHRFGLHHDTHAPFAARLPPTAALLAGSTNEELVERAESMDIAGVGAFLLATLVPTGTLSSSIT